MDYFQVAFAAWLSEALPRSWNSVTNDVSKDAAAIKILCDKLSSDVKAGKIKEAASKLRIATWGQIVIAFKKEFEIAVDRYINTDDRLDSDHDKPDSKQ